MPSVPPAEPRSSLGAVSALHVAALKEQLSQPAPVLELAPPGMGNHPPQISRDRAIAAKVAEMQARLSARRGQGRAAFDEATQPPPTVEIVTSQFHAKRLETRARDAAVHGRDEAAAALAAKAAQIQAELTIRQGLAKRAFHRSVAR